MCFLLICHPSIYDNMCLHNYKTGSFSFICTKIRTPIHMQKTIKTLILTGAKKHTLKIVCNIIGTSMFLYNILHLPNIFPTAIVYMNQKTSSFSPKELRTNHIGTCQIAHTNSIHIKLTPKRIFLNDSLLLYIIRKQSNHNFPQSFFECLVLELSHLI